MGRITATIAAILLGLGLIYASLMGEANVQPDHAKAKPQAQEPAAVLSAND